MNDPGTGQDWPKDMMGSNATGDHREVVRKINATLAGPVVEVLAELVPAVRGLPRRHALEEILGDVGMLDQCFLAFHASPDRFRHLLVNKQKVPVADAEALLDCGRSLEQVVAMVVRTAAKRHFRRRLDGAKALSAARARRRQARPDLFHRILAIFGEGGEGKQVRLRSEVLYAAIQDYLLHDWQVPLVPEYAGLPASTVRRLGARLLDYRRTEDVRRLKEDPDHAPVPLAEGEGRRSLTASLRAMAGAAEAGGAPAAVSGGSGPRPAGGMAPVPKTEAASTVKDERARIEDILTTDGKRLKASAFSAVLLDPKVRSALPNAEQTVRITGVLQGVGGLVTKQIVGELGLRKDQLAILLLTAHTVLGEANFERVFGLPGKPDYVGKILARAKAFKIDQHTPVTEIAQFMTATLGGKPAATKPAEKAGA